MIPFKHPAFDSILVALKSTPPQRWAPNLCIETCHGNCSIVVSLPDEIRPSNWNSILRKPLWGITDAIKQELS